MLLLSMAILMHFILIILFSKCALHDIRKLFLEKKLYMATFFICAYGEYSICVIFAIFRCIFVIIANA